jgi:hypothetical protein
MLLPTVRLFDSLKIGYGSAPNHSKDRSTHTAKGEITHTMSARQAIRKALMQFLDVLKKSNIRERRQK